MEIDIEEEYKTEAYQQTMNIDTENTEKLKIVTNIIENDGGQSTNLNNNSSLMKQKKFQIFLLTLQ